MTGQKVQSVPLPGTGIPAAPVIDTHRIGETGYEGIPGTRARSATSEKIMPGLTLPLRRSPALSREVSISPDEAGCRPLVGRGSIAFGQTRTSLLTALGSACRRAEGG